MANRRYIPKFQEGGYFGGEAMEGKRGLDIRNLFKGFEKKKKFFEEGMAKRKKWAGISDVFEKILSFVPGWGQAGSSILDFLSEQAMQQKISLEGGPDLESLETMWTGGEGEAIQEEFEKIYGAADVSLEEGLIRGATSFMGSEVGGKFMDKIMGDIFKGKDVMEKIPVSDTSKLFSPLSEVPLGKLPIESMNLDISPTMLENLPSPFTEDTPLSLDYADFLSKPEAIDVPERSSMFSKQGFKSFLQDYFRPMGVYRANTGQYEYQQGGQVPKYYGGGNVGSGSPTISDYFSTQGKTADGSDTESLAEKLGRI